MRTELDQRMDAVMAALAGEGGDLKLTTIDVGGQTLPMIGAAPPALSHYFAHFCDLHKDAEFLIAGDERLTFGAVFPQAQAVARALVAGMGVQKGDRVGIAMRNSPSWIVLYMGILMAGGIATLLNGWWQAEEMEDAIRDVACGLVLADPPRAKRLAAIAGLPAKVVEIDDLKPLAEALAPLITHDHATTALPMLSGDDDATILFTSGSTGQSKGALSDHRAVVQGTFNYLAQAMMMVALATQDGNPPIGQPSTLLNVPLFHVTAEVPVMLQSFAMGRKLVLMPKWDAEEAMRLIEAEKITYFVGVPLMSFEMLTHPNRQKYDLSTVADFAAGGAPRPVDHVRRIAEEMPGSPLIGYGLTETNGIGCGNWRSNYVAKPNSTGRPSAPLVDLAILDDAGKPVAQGERGEISIRSVCLFKGYWNNREATAACMTADGYFRTGDIGYLDAEGYVFIVDRKKDIIIRGGENISCQEVEAALYQHPEVAEAAVFGLPDEKYGEVPGAVVHPADGAALTPDDLCAFLAEHIAAFKVPQRIWIAHDPLPRLGTEKIDKVTLRAAYRARAQAEAA
ncbi:Acyl-CoA synthetase (AMP-forming)/AMP-acid ligase II [Sphingomonas sp. EC-HK361]|uniref:class I adenylate-forming enzyme family protein n=1 Tax=Sphingomonas sp. EC-HK361 TaxID=2038397 RepID=UPI00125A88AA|nr:class I adenylate-forming enzyme family protein [Sphingomonas sp. EC-HK361]VVT20404.1 Acyl-CoA synthetase (AMP-forming)/AMP-acid ligase II [Sphingomonas sp. EC-HK361]